jgi:hypothetical protein
VAAVLIRIVLAALALGASSLAPADTHVGELLWPLPSSQVVTGGFADTRPDHFHGGVDLRARTPEPVVAPTDGWVERFAVQPGGYGRALYFRLADGRTAVFGHLSCFAPPVEKALRDSELVTGTYRIDVSYSEPHDSLRFKRGDLLAFTGRTGSGPAHLHYEIREGAVQTDPLANYEPLDQDKPVIVGLWFTTASQYSPAGLGTRLEMASDSQPIWLTHSHQPIVENEPVAFCIQTYDPGPWGRNAVPSTLRIKHRGAVLYEAHPARIDLAEPKNFYWAIVWPMQLHGRKDIRRLFAPLPPARYRRTPDDNSGWIAGLRQDTLSIEVADRAGNITTALVPVTCGDFDSTQTPMPPTELSVGSFTVQSNDATLSWTSLDSVAPREVELSPGELGFAKPCTLSYQLTASETSKGLFFYERSVAGRIKSIWRTVSLEGDSMMSCAILHSGTYGVALDTGAPSLQLSSRQGMIRFRVRDGYSGIDDGSIRCTVDGATAIAEYETDISGGFIWTQEPLKRGKHHVEFSAADRVGNLGQWTADVRIP